MKLAKILENYKYVNGKGIIYGEDLEKTFNQLLKLPEFKDVKKINLIDLPIYMRYTDDNTIMRLGKGLYVDETRETVTESVKEHLINGNLMFNEEIDIYSLQLGGEMYNPKQTSILNLGEGIFLTPTIYNPLTFQPFREIKVIFSPESKEDEKERILRIKNDFNDFVDKMVNNSLSNEEQLTNRCVIIRCSERSINYN